MKLGLLHLIVISALLAADSASADAEIMLGLTDTSKQDLVSAEKHFSRAVSLQPANYRAHAYLGSTWLRQQKLTEARGAFNTVLRLSPRNPSAHYNLGVIDMLEKRPSDALAHFSTASQANPTDAAALIGMIECQLDLKQSQAVIQSARRLETLLPADSPALMQIGAAMAAQGEYRAALPLLRRYAAAHPESFDAGFNLSLAWSRTGSPDQAASAIQPLLRHSRAAEAWDLLGAIEEQRGNQQTAVAAFEKAVALAPANEAFSVNYGSSLVSVGDFDRAAVVFNRVVEENPRSLRARLGSGSVAYLAGRYEEAARTLLHAVRIDPNAAPAWDLLGKTYESVPGMQAEIKDAFGQYLRTEPKDAAAWLHFGTMLYLSASESKQFESATHYLRRAITIDPGLASAHLQLGIVSQAENKLEEAVAHFKRAVRLASSSAPARYRLAIAYQKLGLREQARIEMDQFRRLRETQSDEEKAQVVRALTSVGR